MTQRVVRWKAQLSVLVLIGAVITLQEIRNAPQALATPLWSYARYMSSVDTGHAYDLGCTLANHVDDGTRPRDSLTVLDFGEPIQIDSSTWGADLWGGPDSSTGAIRNAAQNFGLGYYNCIDSPNATAKIAIGANSDWASAWGTTKETNSGKAWADMINAANNWASSHSYTGWISFAGANDMELDFKGPTDTRAWVDGFAADIDNWNLFDFGDAAGCSETAGNYSACGTPNHSDWDSSDVWYISWGSGVSNAAPEIYHDNLAAEWYRLSRYGLDNHPAAGKINFVSSFSEKAACGCSENGPDEAWTALTNGLTGGTADDVRWSQNVVWD